MAERQKFLGRKVAIRILIAEKHPDNRGDRERIQNPGLLPWREVEARQVTKNQRQPCAPDEELEHHHQKEFEARSIIHSLINASLRGLILGRKLRQTAAWPDSPKTLTVLPHRGG